VRSDWFGEFIRALDELESASLLIFHGFSLLPMVYGEKAWAGEGLTWQGA